MSDTSPSPTSRAPLPEGTVPVGVGLFLAGIAAYAFFKVGQEALGKEHFKPIVALWFTTFALVPGVFMPVEQELGRALAHRRALHQGGRPVVQRVTSLSFMLSGVFLIAIGIASHWLTKDMFEGYGLVTVALMISFIAYGPFHIARGIASGSGRFTTYGTIMGIDGVVRIVACVVLWQLGVESVGAYAIAVVAAPLVAVLYAGARGDLHTEPGPEAPFSEVTPNLGWLLLGSVMAAALVNAGPLGVSILANSHEAAKVTAFGNGVLLSRIPLFLFQAVQAALLPRLARLAAKGDLAEFSKGFMLLLKVVAGVAIVGTAGSAVLGPKVLDIMYGGGLDTRTLTLLAFASGVYMLALSIAQGVIALHGHRWVALGWLSSMTAFLVVTAFSSNDLYLRVELGLVSGSLCGVLVFSYALRTLMAQGATPDAELFVEGILESPFED